MQVDPSQLKAFLLDTNLITKKELEKAEKDAAKAKQKLDDFLVKTGLIKEEESTKLKAYILGIPFVNLEDEKIPLRFFK